MSTKEPVVYPMPSGYELGMLVQQIADTDEPRAIILDFLQRSILVHPSSDEDSADFTKESLMFLISSVEIEVIEDVSTIEDMLKMVPSSEEIVTLCLNPSHEKTNTYEEKVLWTSIVEEHYALLVTKSSDQWVMRGANLSPQTYPGTD